MRYASGLRALDAIMYQWHSYCKKNCKEHKTIGTSNNSYSFHSYMEESEKAFDVSTIACDPVLSKLPDSIQRLEYYQDL